MKNKSSNISKEIAETTDLIGRGVVVNKLLEVIKKLEKGDYSCISLFDNPLKMY